MDWKPPYESNPIEIPCTSHRNPIEIPCKSHRNPKEIPFFPPEKKPGIQAGRAINDVQAREHQETLGGLAMGKCWA